MFANLSIKSGTTESVACQFWLRCKEVGVGKVYLEKNLHTCRTNYENNYTIFESNKILIKSPRKVCWTNFYYII